MMITTIKVLIMTMDLIISIACMAYVCSSNAEDVSGRRIDVFLTILLLSNAACLFWRL